MASLSHRAAPLLARALTKASALTTGCLLNPTGVTPNPTYYRNSGTQPKDLPCPEGEPLLGHAAPSFLLEGAGRDSDWISYSLL